MDADPAAPDRTNLECLRVGTAGWAIPRAVAEQFPTQGSGLERYAARFTAVEINSTFYRSHQSATYARWAQATPAGFRFAVKAPKAVTHEARLADTGGMMAAFLAEVAQLGPKLGPILIQLPPSLAFDKQVAERFLRNFRNQWTGPVAWEPRHATWFETDAEVLLREHQIARVAADPARHPGAGAPGGWDGFAYWRLHGSPRMYYSSYDDPFLANLASQLQACATECWCILDNTTSGAAAANALRLQAMSGL